MTNQSNSREAVETSLVALRVGCGLFALIQGLFKFLLPAQTFVWLGVLVHAQPMQSHVSWYLVVLGLAEIGLGISILLGMGLNICGWVFAAWSLFYGTLAIGGVVVSGGVQLIIAANQASPTALFAMFIAQTMVAGLMPAGIALAQLGQYHSRKTA